MFLDDLKRTWSGSDTWVCTPKPSGFYWLNAPEKSTPKPTPNLIQFQFLVPLITKYFITVKSVKLLNLFEFLFLDIYLIWTVSSSAHSNNLKLTKTPNPPSCIIMIWRVAVSHNTPPLWSAARTICLLPAAGHQSLGLQVGPLKNRVSLTKKTQTGLMFFGKIRFFKPWKRSEAVRRRGFATDRRRWRRFASQCLFVQGPKDLSAT